VNGQRTEWSRSPQWRYENRRRVSSSGQTLELPRE
jgi:hypothetical protein